MSSICTKYGIHPTQAKNWQEQALDTLRSAFDGASGKELRKKDDMIDELYKEIGQLTVERDWLKKKMEGIDY